MGKLSHEMGRDAPATILVQGCRFCRGVQYCKSNIFILLVSLTAVRALGYHDQTKENNRMQ